MKAAELDFWKGELEVSPHFNGLQAAVSSHVLHTAV